MSDDDAPDGYKMAEVGRVPEGWEVVELRNTAKYFVDGDWIELPYITKEGIRLIQTGNIGIGNFKNNEDKEKRISSQTFKDLKCHPVYPGDILICRLAEPIGRCCIVPKFENMYITAVDNTIYRVDETIINKEFVVQYINEVSTLSRIAKESGGSTRQRISRKNLETILVPLPPLPEQRHIAEILSVADETVERTGALIAKYRQIKAGLMTDLLTSGIDEAGRRRSEGTHEFKDSPLGRVPEGWEVGLLSNIAQIDMGQSPDGDTYNSVGNGKPLLNGPVEFGAIHPIPIQWTSKPTKMCSPKDILFCVRGSTTGRMNVADQGYCIGRGVAAIRGISNIGDTSYIKYYLEREKQPIFSLASGGGSTFPNITSKDLSNLPCMRPSLPEQHCIAEILTAADDRIEKEERYRNKLLQIKKGLMQDLLTGKVRTKAGAEA